MREDGILIMGVSETAGADDPLLEEQACGDVFYFKKNSAGKTPPETTRKGKEFPESSGPGKRVVLPGRSLAIDPAEVGNLLSDEEASARITLGIRKILDARGDGETLSGRGNELAVSALFLLNRGDFSGADPVLVFIEDHSASAAADFLRGEYFYLQDMFTEAEFHYKVSQGRNSDFWPACYRLSSLAPGEVLRKHRVKEALESLSRGRDLQYEVFIGGFSPEYYRGALVKLCAG
jgi:hypothetical protein